MQRCSMLIVIEEIFLIFEMIFGNYSYWIPKNFSLSIVRCQNRSLEKGSFKKYFMVIC